MGYQRRVTLRCLCDDLTSDWNDVSQQRAFQALRATIDASDRDSDIVHALESVPTTALAEHPLVSSFFAAFDRDDAEILRESISGLSEPHWWKQKVSRWRGAATDAEVVGEAEVWLCAGGIRAQSDERDFYSRFMDDVKRRGPEYFLPAPADRRLQHVEAKLARLTAWEEQLRLAVLVCVAEADTGGARRSLHVPAPAPADVSELLVHLIVEVDKTDIDGVEVAEVTLHAKDHDHRRPHLVRNAVEVAMSVIESTVEDWRLLPGVEASEIWSTLASPELLVSAHRAQSDGELPAELGAAGFRFAVRAHYASKDQIVDATVEGNAVRALCGQWFVPTSDPDQLPVCPVCADAHRGLSA